MFLFMEGSCRPQHGSRLQYSRSNLPTAWTRRTAAGRHV